jgi:hypothetical protein
MLRGIRLGAATAAVAVLALSGAAAAGANGHGTVERPPGDRVHVSTTGDNSELVDRIPIAKQRGAKPRVVMSLGPDRLPLLRSGDHLGISSEVQLTVNCDKKSRRCVGPIYHYNPKVDVALRLTTSAGSTGGTLLARPKSSVCRQRLPDREHHCVIVFTGAGMNIGNVNSLPCPPDRCFVNLVIDSHNRRAGRGDSLLVGGNRPDGSIPQDRGRVNAIVRSPADGDYPKPKVTKARVHKALPLDLKSRVVYSQRLRDVRAGDQLEVQAAVFTDISKVRYAAVTTTKVILAEKRLGTHPGALARHVGGDGEITEGNGYNCTQNKPTCISRKAGVLRITKDARSGGKLRNLYVNVVVIVGPKRKRAKPGDRDHVLDRGDLEVTRYRNPRH